MKARTLPYPGAPQIQNLVATMILHGNSAASLKSSGLQRIAGWQGFDVADLTAEFTRQEQAASLKPCGEVLDK